MDGVLLGGFDYNKVRALLAYLAVEHKQPHTRAFLCALLWPDLSENAARQNLSQALTRLRQVVGDKQAETPYLLATTDTVQLNPAARWQVDVHTFSERIATAERHPHRAWHLCTICATALQEAVACYEGDFLAHFYLSDSVPFEEWALPLRQRLRGRMLSALERLVRYAEWRGDFGSGIENAHRQIVLEPLRDHAHRELMRLLALGEQQSAALAHYAHFSALLESEVGAEPEAETTSLYARIRTNPLDPALRQITPPPLALPALPTPLIGRARELAVIRELLSADTTRLLTVTGAPGMGKTRLALEIAHDLRFEYEDGVYWMELTAVSAAEGVPVALANELRVKEQPHHTIIEAVIDHLRTRHCFIVLDNFEQVLEAADFIARLLDRCPDVVLLITSRAPLQLRTEFQFPLEPLALPASNATLEEIAGAAAVELFTQRVQAIDPTWQPTPDTLPAVATLCRKVDGLPLAIELIAPRLKSLSVAEILQHFESPLNVAPPGPRDMPLRHRTLRSAIQWSYERLTTNEQEVFGCLGLFAGGCTVESAQAVVGDSVEVFPLLESLHNTSLLYTRSLNGATRFHQLETISDYAREMLAATGNAEQAIARFVDCYLTMADEAYVELLGKEQAHWSAHLAAEHDNFRAAMRLAYQYDHSESLLRIATGIWRFWWQRGNLHEALEWLEKGLTMGEPVAGGVRSRALRAAGVIAMGLNDYPRARRMLEEAMETALLTNDIYDHGSARTNLGMVLREQGEFEAACANLEQSAALMRTLEDPRRVKFPLIILASLYVRMGRIEEAGMLYEECLRLNRDLGDTEGTANALFGIGSVLGAKGDYTGAKRWCEESLALYQTLNHQFGAGWAYSALGDIARNAGVHTEALSAYRQSLQIWMERGDWVSGARIMEGIAGVLAETGEVGRAARLLGAAERICDHANVKRTVPEQIDHEALIARCRAILEDWHFENAWEVGRQLPAEKAFELAF
jgi:predicted ATPase/DNA-binding SARP family transcriptional activator